MKRLLTWLAAGCAVSSCGTPGPTTEYCKSRMAGDLVITEVLNDPDGPDTGAEFIEVFNTLSTPIELKGMSVYVSNVDGTGLKSHVIRAGTAPAHGYFTLGDIRTGANPPSIDYSYEDSLGSMPNSNLLVGFKCEGRLIDEVKLVKAPKSGHSRQLDGKLAPDATLNNDETKFCDAPDLGPGTSYSSPRSQNPECPLEVPSGTCFEDNAVRPVVPPGVGQLFVSEVMADPKATADTDGEWIELHALADVDLNGLTLSGSSGKRVFSDAQCLKVAAGTDVLLAHSQDPAVNGHLAAVFTTFAFSLAQAGGVLTLSNGDAGIDSAAYSKAIGGVAWQLDPTLLNATANDDPASFCPATAFISLTADAGDRGTPGAPNTTCPPKLHAGECIDPVTSNVRAVVEPVVGDLVISEVMNDPAAAFSNGEFFELQVKSPVDLNDLIMTSGTSVSRVSSATCLSPDLGSYVVFGKSTDPVANGGLPNLTGTFSFSLLNSGGTLTVSVASDAGPPVEIDHAAYPATTTATKGVSKQLPPGKLDNVSNDLASSFCATPDGVTYGDIPGGAPDGGVLPGMRGTPGLANRECDGGM